MKKLIILLILACIIIPVKAQIWGNTLKNDSIFCADITGTDSVYYKRLRSPQGAFVFYDCRSFADNSTATITIGYAVEDGGIWQPIANGVYTLDSTLVSYDANGDSIKGQGIDIDNSTAQYIVTWLQKGNATNDTVILKINK